MSRLFTFLMLLMPQMAYAGIDDTINEWTQPVATLITTIVFFRLPIPGFADGATGIAMTSAAFEHQFSWFPIPLAIAGILFAFSTMISWSYYGLKGWTYLFGEDQRGQTAYKLIFCFFVVLGCMVQLGPILDISDALVFLICVPNILCLYLLSPIVRREMDDYFSRLRSGEIKRFKNSG